MLIKVYDGADSVGGNKIYVEYEGEGLFLDFGLNFARASQFFQEYLRERNTRGIYDLLTLGLIPELNVYRDDLIPSGLDTSSFPKPNLRALLLSHAHLDHSGCAGYLSEDIPIIGSPETFLILKAMKDTGADPVGQEVVYFSRRSRDEGCPHVLKALARGKYEGRHLILTRKASDKAEEFLRFRDPSSKENEIACFKLDLLERWRSSPFKVEALDVDHSIPGACAYRVSGDSTLVYTGDLRLHGGGREKTLALLEKFKEPDILLIEGTRCGGEREANVSEEEVRENCYRLVKEAEGLVIADFSARNFERLLIFKDIAHETGRRLLITAKDAYYLYALSSENRAFSLSNLWILKKWEGDSYKWKSFIYESFSSKLVEPSEVRGNQGDFILCFSLYDFTTLLDINPRSGVYIYSSSEAFNEEEEFDFLRIYNWLKFFDFKIYGFDIEEDGERARPTFAKGFHASGHLSPQDIEMVVETLKPKLIIPVHTENPRWFLRRFKNVRVLRNGDSVVV